MTPSFLKLAFFSWAVLAASIRKCSLVMANASPTCPGCFLRDSTRWKQIWDATLPALESGRGFCNIQWQAPSELDMLELGAWSHWSPGDPVTRVCFFLVGWSTWSWWMMNVRTSGTTVASVQPRSWGIARCGRIRFWGRWDVRFVDS